MKTELSNPEEILNRISGYHQYCLDTPARLGYISRSLCQMLGVSETELQSEGYEGFVHPGDRERYEEFLQRLRKNPQSAACQYRLVTKEGNTIFVSDTMTSYCVDGKMTADSVLTDITELKNENQNLRFLNETIPCGFVKYTCEKAPRITYLNDRMKQILRFPEETGDGFDYLATYTQNIFTMIPVEERGRFARYLERVLEQDTPLAGDMALLRCDGTKVHVFGWVTACVNEQGHREFQSAVMDVTQRHQEKENQEFSRYLKALSEVYDKIFEYDLGNHTVKCLYSQNSPSFKWLENIPMQLETATENWITSTAAEEDRERLRGFFRDFCQRKLPQPDGRPPRIVYRARSSDGSFKTYTGIFLKLGGEISLYCCRYTPEEQENDALRRENDSLKNIQAMTMRFAEGIVAFEVENDRVKPLYTSENVCSFFGYTQEEWTLLAQERPTIRELIAHSGIAYSDVKTLFATGEAEFSYFDMAQNAYRRIRAICSQNYNGSDRCYVMLYNMDARESQNTGAEVRIRTFGYFDVFVGEQPIAFRNEKSKELFALLVDRRGGFVSSEEAIGFLWEEEPANSLTMARYRKVALRLKNILEEYGIGDIVESVNGKRRLIPERVRCDLYDYLSGQEEYSQLFKGSYLTNYSWGESTLAELTGEYLHGAGE
ncbi:MAG: PAS domain S-box protein [Faecousia sp.]